MNYAELGGYEISEFYYSSSPLNNLIRSHGFKLSSSASKFSKQAPIT